MPHNPEWHYKGYSFDAYLLITGVLRMRPDLLDAPPAEVVRYIAEEMGRRVKIRHVKEQQERIRKEKADIAAGLIPPDPTWHQWQLIHGTNEETNN